MDFSIVIPCYNEEKNIPLILEKFRKVIGDIDVEVILVNNGSTDNSQEVIDCFLTNYRFARTILVPVNRGYGYGILQGLKSAQGAYIGWTHADMQTDPGDVLKAFDFIVRENSAESLFIKGKRKGRPVFDRLFTTGMSIFETLYMGEKLIDINAQPNIFPKFFFDRWENPPYDFALDLYAYYMAQKHHLKIIRFDVLFPERVNGESSWNTGLAAKWKFIKRTLAFSKKMKKVGIK